MVARAIDQAARAMSFDLIAPHYRWMEPLLAGRKLQRCRTHHLPRLGKPENVLILGEGPGKFLAEFRSRFPEVPITCIDASERMLALAQNRMLRAGTRGNQIRFIHGDALTVQLQTAAYDLIVTHFFLDCFDTAELEKLILKLSQAAQPNASWLVADFSIPGSGLARLRAQVIHWCMYAFFRRVTKVSAKALTVPDDLLYRHGFRLVDRSRSELGLLHSDLWSR
jgi:ubiquinone/menaquinone biosynthesis C-methylase UbiE